jgi:hypothetical protein
MQVVKRFLEKALEKGLKQYPIVALTGPRQSGKTTMLREFFKGYRYVSLENPDVREYAQRDPNGFLAEYDKYVVLDEVQRVPHLFSYLQTIVDEQKIMGQFILSGSHNFQLMENITQSLAGRVALFKLLPFDTNELKTANLLERDWKKAIVKGFYPAIYDRDLEPANFYSNYVQTYVERDVALITNIQDRRRFQNFLSLCAARHSQLLNLNNLANECGISQPTAKSWLSILESSYILFQVAPYFENFSKRVVKSSKIYFYDTGLLSYLLGIRNVEDVGESTLWGSLFENLVVSEMYKQNEHQNLLHDFWFWRDSAGKEIDLIIKRGLKFDLFEIKSTQTIKQQLFKHMDYFDRISQKKKDQHENSSTIKRVASKTLIYGGASNQKRTEYEIRVWNEGLK